MVRFTLRLLFLTVLAPGLVTVLHTAMVAPSVILAAAAPGPCGQVSHLNLYDAVPGFDTHLAPQAAGTGTSKPQLKPDTVCVWTSAAPGGPSQTSFRARTTFYLNATWQIGKAASLKKRGIKPAKYSLQVRWDVYTGQQKNIATIPPSSKRLERVQKLAASKGASGKYTMSPPPGITLAKPGTYTVVASTLAFGPNCKAPNGCHGPVRATWLTITP